MTRRMQIRLLGHVDASVDDRPLELGGAKQRAVLAMLALEANRLVSADRLIEGLWGEQPPPSAAKMVQNYVLAAAQGAGRRRRGGDRHTRARVRAADRPRADRRSALRAACGRGRARRLRRRGAPGAGAVPRRAAGRHRRRAVRRRRDPPARGVAADRRRAGDRRRPGRRSPPGGASARSTRCWPRTRCASACTRSGCSRCIAAAARPTRSRPFARRARRWSRRSASSRAPSCSACRPRSCARTRRSTSSGRARAAAGAGGGGRAAADRPRARAADACGAAARRGRAGHARRRVRHGQDAARGRAGARVPARRRRACSTPPGSGPAEVALAAIARARDERGPALLVLDDADRAAGRGPAGAVRALRERRGARARHRACRPRRWRGWSRARRSRWSRSTPRPCARSRRCTPRPAATSRSTRCWRTSRGVARRVHEAASEWARREATEPRRRARRPDRGRPQPGARARDRAGRERRRSAVDARAPRPVRPAGTAAPVVCPYKGLAPFDRDDAEYFFGREGLVAELVAHLVGAALLAVVGPSGSGKSSVVRAGSAARARGRRAAGQPATGRRP